MSEFRDMAPSAIHEVLETRMSAIERSLALLQTGISKAQKTNDDTFVRAFDRISALEAGMTDANDAILHVRERISELMNDETVNTISERQYKMDKTLDDICALYADLVKHMNDNIANTVTVHNSQIHELYTLVQREKKTATFERCDAQGPRFSGEPKAFYACTLSMGHSGDEHISEHRDHVVYWNREATFE